MFLRFVRFNVVGALGVAVQLGVLMLLVSGLGVHYLTATAVAIELSVLHNFFWHERWTWGGRTGSGQGPMPNAQCRMLNAEGRVRNGDGPMPNAQCRMLNAEHDPEGTMRKGGRLRRLVAFHAANGMVSMVGSLALMPLFVTSLGLHYVAANVATIAATGALNFLLGDKVVFTARASTQSRVRSTPNP